MNRPSAEPLRIGDWYVDPQSGHVSRDGETVRLEARTLRLLLCLAERAGDVVSIEELLQEAWAGVIVSSDSVYQAVTSLRRVLGDDPKRPTYIETVPRLGYRMVAKVSVASNHPGLAAEVSVAPHGPQPAKPRRGSYVLSGSAFALSLALVAAYVLTGRFASKAHSGSAAATPPAEKSIAVVPFLDLTEGMSHEYFADGMTEEVIGKLSNVPGFRVAAPTTSFYLKRKPIAIKEIARTLGVTYVLDGSVRKSHGTLRIAARLSRGDTGYVVWAQTYDRPAGDMLTVQDDIATQVTKALRASIDSRQRLKAGAGAVPPYSRSHIASARTAGCCRRSALRPGTRGRGARGFRFVS